MKVSVIIPTRERIPFLQKCIKSIELQTEKPEEVIIIVHKDDQATKRYIKNLNTKLFINYYETDGGLCKARNVGIENAKCQIIVFIDDDVILDQNYIENIKIIFDKDNISVLAGYTLDIIDLLTPGIVKKSEIEFINRNRDNILVKSIINEIYERYPKKINLFNDRNRLWVYFLIKMFRNFLKSLILQEWPIKGKILPSGYRSEMPEVINDNGLVKVEWFNGGNFAAKKNVLRKFMANESMENTPYALNEDLELSARIGKDYDIFLSSKMKLFHLRAPTGIKINERLRFSSMVINLHKISQLRGNKFAYWWSIIGLIFSRIVLLPFSFSIAVSELKGINDGIKELRNLNE